MSQENTIDISRDYKCAYVQRVLVTTGLRCDVGFLCHRPCEADQDCLSAAYGLVESGLNDPFEVYPPCIVLNSFEYL